MSRHDLSLAALQGPGMTKSHDEKILLGEAAEHLILAGLLRSGVRRTLQGRHQLLAGLA